MAYFDFLNIVFAPLLALPTLLAIIILSLLISLIILLITKYSTDQTLMKNMKEEIKAYQKQIKELKNEPAKAMEVQKKSMEVNMRYMTHSLKPTIITFIPIILIFGWMSSTFAYESIKPNQEFNMTVFPKQNVDGDAEIIASDGITVLGNKTQKIEEHINKGIFKEDTIKKATWTLKGDEGQYTLEFDLNGEKQQKDVLITNDEKYIEPKKKISNSAINLIQIDYKQKKILNVFGWRIGWLGTYIIFSIIFTMALRKVMKVY